MKKILIALAILTTLAAVLTGINIAQKGFGGYRGESMEQILGVPADRATPSDIERLSRAKVVRLFYAAPAPRYDEMNGEYRAAMVGGGIMGPPSRLYTAFIFGPGRWEGKAFSPKEGLGYNIFKRTQDGRGIIRRVRKMKTRIGKSQYDGRESFHLDYSSFEKGLFHSMRDEIRRINPRLYIGMGSLAAGGGTVNPMPFILSGKTSPWVGPDRE